MAPEHLRVDVVATGSRAKAQHEAACPEIGPICDVRDEPPQEHHTTLWVSELRLLAEYGLSERLALQGSVPLRIVDTRTRYTDLDGDALQLDYDNIHHRDETVVGLGDVQVLLHGGLRLAGFAVGARLGLSLPTGEVHDDPFRLGAAGLPHQHLQLGTGTFDPVVGLDIGRTSGPWSGSAFAQVQAPLYEGRRGYHAGARMLGGLAASRALGPVSLRLMVTAAHETAERWHGVVPVEDGNRGRTDLFLGPGATIPFAKDYSASVDLGVRIYGQTAGAQLEMPIVLSVSLGRLFHLERGAHVEPLTIDPRDGDVADAVVQGEARPLVGVPGKWTVFDFWATWCEACGVLDGSLRRLAAERDDLAVRRVNIVDLDSPIAQRELPGVTTLPRVRLVGPDGRMVWEASGTPTQLMDGLRARMVGPRPTAASTEQVVRLVVTKAGYEPARVEVTKGKPVKLIVTRQTEDTCATDIVIPALGIKRDLPLGQPVEIIFTPTRAGDLVYACSMDMIRGVLTVR